MSLSKHQFFSRVADGIGFWALFLLIWLPASESSPYVISDDRVRNLDVTPVLGRGYSISTNSFQSTCLVVDETTVPSYNYDYYFTDFTSSTDSESALQGKVSGSFGYYGIKAEFNAEHKQSSKTKTKTHIVTSTMRVERYYSSVREEMSRLTRDAEMLLENEDYVGFFKACGPNYVRGIRRAQEVTAIFSFQSDSEEMAKEFAGSFEVSGWGSSVGAETSLDSKFSSMASTLRIKILGFGLGLSEDGSQTLVATSMQEYNDVMKFAFKSMTQTENSASIGMIYGIELVPWVDNTAFQVAAKIDDAQIRLPMPRSVIPRAIPIQSSSPPTVFSASDRGKFKCKDPDYRIDKFGKCCEPSMMEAIAPSGPSPSPSPSPGVSGTNPGGTSAATTVTIDYSEMVCRPLRSLHPSLKKNNLSTNGEFVALLDSLVRYRLNTIFTLEKCITSLNSLPSRYDYYFLKAQDNVKYDGTIEAKYTVAELKMALDPFGDYALVRHMGTELDEFLKMFYEPCLSDLFGMNIGVSAGEDPMYFMAESWFNHESCLYLSCLADNMRWNRKDGGCIPSLITGPTAPDYDTNVASLGTDQCLKEVSDDGTKEVCKVKSQDLKDVQDKMKNCWDHTQNQGVTQGNQGSTRAVKSPVYLMDHFCNPVISDEKASATTIKDIESWRGQCKPGSTGGTTNPSGNPGSTTRNRPSSF